MDFIERIFGFSPDHGSGSFELLLFAIPLAGLAVLFRLHHANRRNRLHHANRRNYRKDQ